jgi:hypothetical protein
MHETISDPALDPRDDTPALSREELMTPVGCLLQTQPTPTAP